MPKKDFTSFDLHAIVGEIKNKLVDARVNNIYQLDAKTLLLKLHKVNEPPIRLVLEAGRRMHLTSYSLEKPHTPPAFCMTLRKYLPGAWIDDVEQYGFERVVTFNFRAKEGPLRLILELFGEGNIVLADAESKILQALFFKRMRDRNIVRNDTYQLPPSNAKNPFTIKKEQLNDGLKVAGDTEVVRAVVRLLGIGGVYAEELLLRANVEKTKPSASLTTAETEAIFTALQELLSAVSPDKLEPNIVLNENGNFLDVAPIKLKRYEQFNLQPYPSFSQALDEFYVVVTTAEKATASVDTTQLKRESDRLKRMVADQEQAMKEGDMRAAHDKQIGDLIYAHLGELQELLNKFASVWRAGGDIPSVVVEVKEAKKSGKRPETLFESLDGRSLSINVRVDDLPFSLSVRQNLYENAADFYDRGKRAKQKMDGTAQALKDSRNKQTDIENQLSKVEALKTAAPAEALEEIASRKVEAKEWFEKFRWFISSEGFLVVAGKDAVSNEVLIKKYASTYDIVFHVDIVGSPFAVVKTEGKEPGEQTLRETAEFAAAFSRAWRESMGSVDVYWVKPEQLSKSGPSGEFVPHGAFTVNGKRNWMRGVPLHLSIGLEEREQAKFIGGPVDAVKSKTKIYVGLLPGDVEGKELLKQILRSIALKLPKEEREKVTKSSIETIRELVPYTKARISVN